MLGLEGGQGGGVAVLGGREGERSGGRSCSSWREGGREGGPVFGGREGETVLKGDREGNKKQMSIVVWVIKSSTLNNRAW